MTNLDGNSFMTGSHHQPAAAEEKYACTRYCTWVHLFGNAYQCHTHNQLHVCDQNCRQLVPATATTSVCRLSKVGSCISHGRSHALTLSLALRSFVRSFVLEEGVHDDQRRHGRGRCEAESDSPWWCGVRRTPTQQQHQADEQRRAVTVLDCSVLFLPTLVD
jgi:hypothetical protein